MIKLDNCNADVKSKVAEKYLVPADTSNVFIEDGLVFELYGTAKMVLSLNTSKMDLFHIHSGSVNQ